jgi:hypothetical protein
LSSKRIKEIKYMAKKITQIPTGTLPEGFIPLDGLVTDSFLTLLAANPDSGITARQIEGGHSFTAPDGRIITTSTAPEGGVTVVNPGRRK